MDDESLSKVLGVVFLLLLLLVFVILIKRNLKVEVKEVQQVENKTCLLCDKPAHENWPIIQTSRLDQDISRHKRLHGLGAMHIHVDSNEFEPVLCVTHKRMIERKWEQIFSDVHARRLQLEVRIEEELAALESGGMLNWAKSELKK